MNKVSDKKIIGFPRKARGIGGPSTFQKRFEAKLKEDGWMVVYPEDKITPNIVVVIAVTTKLFWLYKCKMSGTKIIHRINGMNWKHKIVRLQLKIKYYNLLVNFLAKIIRKYISDFNVYQSAFAKNWWTEVAGITKTPNTIIHNGTDLELFHPSLDSNSKLRIICVEGNYDLEEGNIEIIKTLASCKLESKKRIEIRLVGNMSPEFKERFASFQNISFEGKKEKDQIPEEMRKSDIFLTLDVNPACPNSVIEAMASGLPIIGFNSGSIYELVGNDAGKIMEYGSDVWKLEIPDLSKIPCSLNEIDKKLDNYKKAARNNAIEKFNVEEMYKKYLAVINSLLDHSKQEF